MKTASKQTDLDVYDEETAAAKLKVSVRTLRRWRKDGKLPFIRTGILVRYNDDCLRAYLKANTQNLNLAA
jgi:excisionase family DNA binding protein